MSTKAEAVHFLLSQVRNSAGNLAGGTATFYAAGTTTLKTIWLDRDKATPAANPYTLDSNGTAQLYADGLYKIVIKNSGGVTVYTRDNIGFGLQNGPWIDVAEYASLTAAVTAIGSTETDLIIDSTTTVTANTTVPANVKIKVTRKGRINQSAYTFTVNCPFEAGSHQVFTGTGDVTGLKEARAEWFGNNATPGTTDMAAALQAAFNASKKVVIDSIIGVSVPSQLQNGSELELNPNGSIKAITGFTGDAVLIADGVSSNAVMENLLIHGNGTIDGDNIAQTGVFIKLARRSMIENIVVKNCPLYGIRIGDPAAVMSSYQVTTKDVHIENTYSSTYVLNNANSIGVFYDNTTDSVIDNCYSIGYRTGFRNNGSSIFYSACHPWSSYHYGPMTYAFYINGTNTSLVNCYADTPTNMGEASITDVYGFYLNAYNTHMINCSGILYYLDAGGKTNSYDNVATGIYVAKADGLYGSITGGHWRSTNAAIKWKTILGGTPSTTTAVLGLTHDGNNYSFGGQNRFYGGIVNGLQLLGSGATTSTVIAHTTSGTNGFLTIDPAPANATSDAWVRLFRSVNTSGYVALELHKGDGTNTPTIKLMANTGNLESTSAGAGLILKTPDGTKRYKIAVDNAGAVTSTLY